MRTDKEWQEAAKAYRHAAYVFEQIKAEFENARDALLALTDGQPESGFDVSVTYQTRKGSIDYKAIVTEMNPDFDCEPFRKESTTFPVIKIIGDKA